MAVERADAAPCLEARSAAPHAGEAVDVPADQVPQRVAAERVTREQDHVDQHDERAHPDPKLRAGAAVQGPACSKENIVRENEDEDDGGVHEESVHVLQNERKASLALVTVSRLAHATGHGIEEKRPVVRLAVVVARSSESAGENQNQERG